MKRVYRALNYFAHFLILNYDGSGCASLSSLVSYVGVTVCIASSTVGLRISALTARITRYKSILMKTGKAMIT